jgi:hypothetical protein
MSGGSSTGRRIRRGDARALALVAGRLALAGRGADARTVASIAIRLARLTGASSALGIAEAVLAEIDKLGSTP